jgi:hypothetical protein
MSLKTNDTVDILSIQSKYHIPKKKVYKIFFLLSLAQLVAAVYYKNIRYTMFCQHKRAH